MVDHWNEMQETVDQLNSAKEVQRQSVEILEKSKVLTAPVKSKFETGNHWIDCVVEGVWNWLVS